MSGRDFRLREAVRFQVCVDSESFDDLLWVVVKI